MTEVKYTYAMKMTVSLLGLVCLYIGFTTELDLFYFREKKIGLFCLCIGFMTELHLCNQDDSKGLIKSCAMSKVVQ